MAPHGTSGGSLKAKLATSCQKRDPDLHPQGLLQKYYQGGYPVGLKDKVERPYALPKHNAIAEAEWCRRVGWFSHPQYLQDVEVLYNERSGSDFEEFYRSMDHTNPIHAAECDQTEKEQEEPPTQAGQTQQMQ